MNILITKRNPAWMAHLYKMISKYFILFMFSRFWNKTNNVYKFATTFLLIVLNLPASGFKVQCWFFTSTNWNHYWNRDHFILFPVYSNDSILLNYSIISQLGYWHFKKSTNYIQISPVLLVFICVCVWHSIQYYHLYRFTCLSQFL